MHISIAILVSALSSAVTVYLYTVDGATLETICSAIFAATHIYSSVKFILYLRSYKRVDETGPYFCRMKVDEVIAGVYRCGNVVIDPVETVQCYAEAPSIVVEKKIVQGMCWCKNRRLKGCVLYVPCTE